MSARMFSAMLSGLIVVLGIILTCSIIISLLLRFTSLSESSFTWIIIGLSFLALFLGGFVSGKKGKEKGWFLGAGTGFLFSILVFLVQYLGYQIQFDSLQYLYHFGYMLVSLIGGILGVNLANQRL
jgi:putative membrane protein (TIGR04086 family)